MCRIGFDVPALGAIEHLIAGEEQKGNVSREFGEERRGFHVDASRQDRVLLTGPRPTLRSAVNNDVGMQVSPETANRPGIG